MRTEAFKKERKYILDSIKESRLNMTSNEQKMFDIIKKTHDVLEVNIKAPFISILSYKKDASDMCLYLSEMFNKKVYQKTCHWTGLIRTFTLNI